MSEFESAALALKGEFDAYVAAVGESPDDPRRVMKAVNDLQTSVLLFAEASVRENGWGNPFVPPVDDERGRARKAAGVVRVEAHYKLQVTNAYTFREFVLQRARETGNTTHDDVDIPVSQIHELFAIDGWDPLRYRRPDLTVIQSRWSVSLDDS